MGRTFWTVVVIVLTAEVATLGIVAAMDAPQTGDAWERLRASGDSVGSRLTCEGSAEVDRTIPEELRGRVVGGQIAIEHDWWCGRTVRSELHMTDEDPRTRYNLEGWDGRP